MRVVSNTSPLSNLAVIGEISLLQKICPTILIPPIIHTELLQEIAIMLCQQQRIRLDEAAQLSDSFTYSFPTKRSGMRPHVAGAHP